MARRSATAGLVVWFLLLFIPTSDTTHIELIHRVVLFAVLVIVPLAFSIVAADDRSWLCKAVVVVQPVAAALTVVSFFVEIGIASAALSCAWLILTGLIALVGLLRLFSRGFSQVAELSIDAGLLYLPVAGAWLVIYRLGVQPFGYGETIILLTVAHFHFAGFAAPIIAGMNGRVLATRAHPRKLFGLSVLAIVSAMPLVAAGITFKAVVGLIGTLLLSVGLLLLAVLTIGWVRPLIGPTGQRSLLLVGALSSCAAMVLASLYSYSLVAQTVILDIPQMAMTHGLLNAFGFVACSLFAWSRITREDLSTHGK